VRSAARTCVPPRAGGGGPRGRAQGLAAAPQRARSARRRPCWQPPGARLSSTAAGSEVRPSRAELPQPEEPRDGSAPSSTPPRSEGRYALEWGDGRRSRDPAGGCHAAPQCTAVDYTLRWAMDSAGGLLRAADTRRAGRVWALTSRRPGILGGGVGPVHLPRLTRQ